MRVVIGGVLLWLVAVCAAAQPAPAGARPDFSGTWVFDQAKSAQPGPDGQVMLAAMLGDEFTARQDAASLVFAIKSGNLRVEAAYKLDGSESHNMSPGAYGQPVVDVISRASWDGNKLVIVSSSVSVIEGRNVTIQTRRVLWIDPAGILVMERTGTPASEVPPSRSVYRKSK
jgi:hypothetical protein